MTMLTDSNMTFKFTDHSPGNTASMIVPTKLNSGHSAPQITITIENLTDSEEAAQILIQKLLRSEEEFCHEIRHGLELYADRTLERNLLSEFEHRLIFNKLEMLLDITSEILLITRDHKVSFTERRGSDFYVDSIGSIYSQKIEPLCYAYTTHINNLEAINQIIADMTKDLNFIRFMRDVGESHAKMLTLTNLLYLPKKHLEYITNLIENVLAMTDHSSLDYEELSDVHEALKTCIQKPGFTRTTSQVALQMSILADLQNYMMFAKNIKQIPICEAGRYFIHASYILKKYENGLKKKLYMMLFSDLILLAEFRSDLILVCEEPLLFSQVASMDFHRKNETEFQITIVNKGKKRRWLSFCQGCAITLRAENLGEKELWEKLIMRQIKILALGGLNSMPFEKFGDGGNEREYGSQKETVLSSGATSRMGNMDNDDYNNVLKNLSPSTCSLRSHSSQSSEIIDLRENPQNKMESAKQPPLLGQSQPKKCYETFFPTRFMNRLRVKTKHRNSERHQAKSNKFGEAREPVWKNKGAGGSASKDESVPMFNVGTPPAITIGYENYSSASYNASQDNLNYSTHISNSTKGYRDSSPQSEPSEIVWSNRVLPSKLYSKRGSVTSKKGRAREAKEQGTAQSDPEIIDSTWSLSKRKADEHRKVLRESRERFFGSTLTASGIAINNYYDDQSNRHKGDNASNRFLKLPVPCFSPRSKTWGCGGQGPHITSASHQTRVSQHYNGQHQCSDYSPSPHSSSTATSPTSSTSPLHSSLTPYPTRTTSQDNLATPSYSSRALSAERPSSAVSYINRTFKSDFSSLLPPVLSSLSASSLVKRRKQKPGYLESTNTKPQSPKPRKEGTNINSLINVMGFMRGTGARYSQDSLSPTTFDAGRSNKSESPSPSPIQGSRLQFLRKKASLPNTNTVDGSIFKFMTQRSSVGASEAINLRLKHVVDIKKGKSYGGNRADDDVNMKVVPPFLEVRGSANRKSLSSPNLVSQMGPREFESTTTVRLPKSSVGHVDGIGKEMMSKHTNSTTTFSRLLGTFRSRRKDNKDSNKQYSDNFHRSLSPTTKPNHSNFIIAEDSTTTSGSNYRSYETSTGSSSFGGLWEKPRDLSHAPIHERKLFNINNYQSEILPGGPSFLDRMAYCFNASDKMGSGGEGKNQNLIMKILYGRRGSIPPSLEKGGKPCDTSKNDNKFYDIVDRKELENALYNPKLSQPFKSGGKPVAKHESVKTFNTYKTNKAIHGPKNSLPSGPFIKNYEDGKESEEGGSGEINDSDASTFLRIPHFFGNRNPSNKSMDSGMHSLTDKSINLDKISQEMSQRTESTSSVDKSYCSTSSNTVKQSDPNLPSVESGGSHNENNSDAGSGSGWSGQGPTRKYKTKGQSMASGHGSKYYGNTAGPKPKNLPDNNAADVKSNKRSISTASEKEYTIPAPYIREVRGKFKKFLRRSQSAGCTKDALAYAQYVSQQPNHVRSPSSKYRGDKGTRFLNYSIANPKNKKDMDVETDKSADIMAITLGLPTVMDLAKEKPTLYAYHHPSAGLHKSKTKSIAQDVKSKFRMLKRRYTDSALATTVKEDTSRPPTITRPESIWKSAIPSYTLRPSPEDALKWAHSFDNLLNNRYGISLFRRFLQTEYSEDNLEFWLACQEYRRVKPHKLQITAHKIYADFIAQKAPHEVNLESNIKNSIFTHLTKPDKASFDEAQKKIQNLMQKDSYSRFLHSSLYQELIKPYSLPPNVA